MTAYSYGCQPYECAPGEGLFCGEPCLLSLPAYSRAQGAVMSLLPCADKPAGSVHGLATHTSILLAFAQPVTRLASRIACGSRRWRLFQDGKALPHPAIHAIVDV